MKHYVLVHGAWEGSWSWDQTRPGLEKLGHRVTAVDLPGTRANRQPLSQVTMESYVQTVVDAINLLDHKVILAGHSMAGAIISQVAEQVPEKIEKLIYVTAFLLENGDSVLEAMQRDRDGEFLPKLNFSADQGSATASPQTWRDIAFHDVDERHVQTALPLVDIAQSTEPFMAKVSVSAENFGSVPKTYIRAANDKMVSPRLQDEMLENWNVDQVHVLNSGHFPTLSMPDELAAAMILDRPWGASQAV